jgi:hypothetical protein
MPNCNPIFYALNPMYLMKFAILDVAVDNVFAQLIILFGIELSAAAPAEARQRHIINVLCDFCLKSFPHRTCTKLKRSLKNWLSLASDAQSGAMGNPLWYSGNGYTFSKSFTWPQRFR